MLDARRVRYAVEDLRKTIGIDKPEDVFPIWYLKHRYWISDVQAQTQSSDPALEGAEKGFDFGLDAYHFDLKQDPPRLALFQAKFSESIANVGRGYRDLSRAVPTLGELIEGNLLTTRENKVITNLRTDLHRLESTVRDQLALEFVVLHLNTDDDEVIGHRTAGARDTLQEAVADAFPNRTYTISQMGPRKMRFGSGGIIVVPPVWQPLTLQMVECTATRDDREIRMYYGIGKLSEIVDLYRSRRDLLLAKNVRYFLSKKSNLEKGPSGRMRETLKNICVDRTVEPELFSFFHNGVTLYAEQVQTTDTGLQLRAPFVLNGCQTVKTAFLFASEPRLRARIDEQRWSRITVPVRVAMTRDEDLIREITINNNRQNNISPPALRANDREQLDLQYRFRRSKIFYERQEGAFKSILDVNPDALTGELENTRDRAVNIVHLARSLSAVAGGTDLFNYAHHPNDIFESDQAYERCFSAKRLASITFLIFLQNLHDVLPLVLKKDLNLEPAEGAPGPGRLGFYAMCLLCRYLARENDRRLVAEYGQALWGKTKTFRDVVASYLGNHRSHIKNALSEKFMTLSDGSTESLKTAFGRAEAILHLGAQIDPFEAFKDLDDWKENEDEDSDD
jgi:hypothetical protein